ncbi:MAG: hypothetical protein WAN40_04950 [Thermoplasmata archaeon]
MTAAALRATAAGPVPASSWELYKGWVIGLVIILIVLAVGAGFWLHYHP